MKARKREEMYLAAGWGSPPEDTIEDIQRRQRLNQDRSDRPVDPRKPILAFGPPMTDTNKPMTDSPDILQDAYENGGNTFHIPSPWPRPGKLKGKTKRKRRTVKRRPGPDLEEGYKKPTALTADSSTCDVEPEYLIMRTTAWLMRARGNRYAGRREADWLEAERLEGLAELWMSRQRLPQGTIWVDD